MQTSAIVCILSLFYFLEAAKAQTGNGIIGFGISLYQDLCCQACYDSLSSLYLRCTTFSSSGELSDNMSDDMSMDMTMGTTSDECYASNTPWLQTMAYCIQQNCDAVGYPAEDQAQCFQKQAVKGASEPTFQDSLPPTSPTVELSTDATWLNVTSLVNRDVYYATYGTEGEFARSEYIHTRYAVVLYLMTIGICIGCGVLALVRSAFPGLQKRLYASTFWAMLQQYIFLPTLFGFRQLESLPGHIGYLPSRTLSIFIAIYIAMNIVLSSTSYQGFWPNTFFASPQFEICEYIGNRTGTLSLVNLSIAILFAGRNNLLIAVTGWSHTTFLTFHRWAARVATLQAVVHSIVYTIAYFYPPDGPKDYATEAAEPFYWWGIIATIAICLATAFAALPLRIKSYEFFLVSHILLAILTLVGCWYHLVPHFGLTYGYQVWLYISFAYWSYDRLARLVRITFYNCLGNSRAIVKVIPDCNVMHVIIFPRVTLGFGPGQHSFLYLPGIGKLWESHSFSVAAWKKQEQVVPMASSSASPFRSTSKEVKGKEGGIVSSHSDSIAEEQQAALPHQNLTQNGASIEFLVRVHSGITSSLQRRVSSSPSGSIMETSVYTEGPYGGYRATLHPLSLADTVLCLVGGIGITYALGFIQEYADTNSQSGENPKTGHGIMKRARRFILAWSAREISLIEYVKDNFLVPRDGVEGFDYSFWCTNPSYTAAQKPESSSEEVQTGRGSGATTPAAARVGRMDIGAVVRSSLEDGRPTTVLVCGPGSMADEATREVVNCVKDGSRVDLIAEAFTW